MGRKKRIKKVLKSKETVEKPITKGEILYVSGLYILVICAVITIILIIIIAMKVFYLS